MQSIPVTDTSINLKRNSFVFHKFQKKIYFNPLASIIHAFMKKHLHKQPTKYHTSFIHLAYSLTYTKINAQ